VQVEVATLCVQCAEQLIAPLHTSATRRLKRPPHQRVYVGLTFQAADAAQPLMRRLKRPPLRRGYRLRLVFVRRAKFLICGSTRVTVQDVAKYKDQTCAAGSGVTWWYTAMTASSSPKKKR
jgi:hypothetical protein